MTPTLTTQGVEEAVELLDKSAQAAGADTYVCLQTLPLLKLLRALADAQREREEAIEFWPPWALNIKAQLEAVGVEFDPDEVDLPATLADWISDFDSECERERTRAERAEQALAECLVALRPFAEASVAADAHYLKHGGLGGPKGLPSASIADFRLAASTHTKLMGSGDSVLQPSASALGSTSMQGSAEPERAP